MGKGGPANISIHALLAEGDSVASSGDTVASTISIHALLAEGDFCGACPPCAKITFLSTPSLRRATCADCGARFTTVISIHALLAEGDTSTIKSAGIAPISIHALLAEGDSRLFLVFWTFWYFYPRPPCGGRRFVQLEQTEQYKFLSTPSLRRATAVVTMVVGFYFNFYPRPPCGGRPVSV